MQLEGVEAFVSVVDAGSFSAAAERLGIAKSMVSRRVAELESRLGAQLLQRTTRRLSLTEAGREFYERASRILIDLDEAEQSVISGQAALRGRLRLTTPLSFGIRHLAAALDQFAQRHPDLTLDIQLDDREVNLIEEGFDLALRIGHLPDSTLVARPLVPIRFVLCASPDYLRTHGEPRHPHELAHHHGLSYSNVSEGQQWSLSHSDGSTLTAHPHPRLRVNNGDLMLRAASDGLGIAVLPTFIAHDALANGKLQAILTAWQPRQATLYAVYASRRHLPVRVRLLIDHLADSFGEQPYWDREMRVVPLHPTP